MPERERFGDFLLHERLAVGGMGELYLATRAERRSPPFALKIMARSYRENPEFVGMFQDEARIGMRLSHSNIVGVHEVGIAESTAFIVMEYVHGENLRAVLRAMDRLGERLAPALAVKLAIDVLRGLDHAHKATNEAGQPLHLVHRDLSPDNILVSYQGEVKLLDFGIAKAEGRTTTTQVGVVKGKPQYMSPEQAKARLVDARSDLFSAAVVLRELLTGERRFTDDEARWESARNWLPQPVPGLPGELDSILLRALEPEPSRRFQSADELATELTRVARSGVLPRAKESLPALLKRLFPQASARTFDTTDVTLLKPPRWSNEDEDRTRAAVNLATGTATASATVPMRRLPDAVTSPGVRRLDAPPRADVIPLPAPTAAPDAGDDDDTRPAADLAAMAETSIAVPPVPAPLPVSDVPVGPTTFGFRGNDDRPTTSSAPPLDRRMAFRAIAVLAPLTALFGGLALWSLWPSGAPDPEPEPEPKPKPKKPRPKPKPRRSPTPRPKTRRRAAPKKTPRRK